MIRRVVNARYLALALLVAAQLSVASHAVEHGVGQHEHDGIPCLYGMPNEDDSHESSPPAITEVTVGKSDADGAVCVDVPRSTSDLGVPPATGPPGSA